MQPKGRLLTRVLVNFCLFMSVLATERAARAGFSVGFGERDTSPPVIDPGKISTGTRSLTRRALILS